MKILLINSRIYPDAGGGPSRATFFLAREFIKKGHDVDVLCKGNVEKTYFHKKIKIIRYRKFPRALRKENCEKYDLVISMSYTFLKLLKKQINPKKIIYRVPSLMTIINSKQKIKLFKKVIENVHLFTVSYMIKKQLTKLTGRKNLEVIYPGIDALKFKEGNLKNNLVLSLGRISKEKNLNSLIKAFSKAKFGKLHIVGDGKEKKKLEKIARQSKRKKDIKFFGRTATPEREFRKAKIFVLPSKYEAFALTLIEAMASGLPCIAFKPDGKKIITASNEIIKNNKTGFLVKNEKEMAEKIDLLLSDKKLRKKMGKAARKEAEKYSWSKTADEILEFVNQTLKHE
jgi:glycosyltransferase involved in cell wall biosynthesis